MVASPSLRRIDLNEKVSVGRHRLLHPSLPTPFEKVAYERERVVACCLAR